MNFNSNPTQKQLITIKNVLQVKQVVITCCALLIGFSLNAREINIPTLPASPYADTEVSTNVILNASRTDVKELNVKLEFLGSLSNNVEIAFGQDINTNGILDIEEIDTTYGWRVGRYFIENVTGWNRIEEVVSGITTNSVIDIKVEIDANMTPKSFSAICDGKPAFEELSLQPPQWLYRSHWNLMRVVRRGVEPSSEWIRCTVVYNHVLILLR